MSRLSGVTAVVVAFRSADQIEGCMTSIPSEMNIIVVDNASPDDSVERALRVRPDARVIVSRTNVGFGMGCELGWRAATRKYVMFLNPDARLNEDAARQLVAVCADRPHSICGPALTDSDGAVRPLRRELSAVRDLVANLPAASRWLPDSARVTVEGTAPQGAPFRVAMVEGACFVTRRETLECIGGFNPRQFLYYEEEWLAARVASVLGACWYVPSAVVGHEGGTSTSSVPEFALFHFFRSRAIVYGVGVSSRRALGRWFAGYAGIGLALARGMLKRSPSVSPRTERAPAVVALRGFHAGVAGSLNRRGRTDA